MCVQVVGLEHQPAEPGFVQIDLAPFHLPIDIRLDRQDRSPIGRTRGFDGFGDKDTLHDLGQYRADARNGSIRPLG